MTAYQGTHDDCPHTHDTTENEQPETYNGWKNYPTWAVNLWLSNDEATYSIAREKTIEGKWSGGPNHQRTHVADILSEWITEDLTPNLGASFASDLLGYALGQVDWYEIADAWIEAVEEQGE